MPEHKIHCPSCDQHLAVPEELAGQKIDCPACNHPLTIPDFAHTFDEPEEEPTGESRQSPALIAGIVAGVLLFGGLGVYLLMGPGDSADEPEVATRPATQTIPPSPGPQPGANPDAEMDLSDLFGMGMMDPEEEIKAINERLAKGQSLNRYNEWGQTELMIAVEADDIDLARRLLENKAHPNATSKDGQLDTALHLAAMQENKAMCELLLDKGARVNKKNKIGFTPLDAALYANEMPGFGGAPPEPSAAGQATVALLKSKGGTSMTPEERAKANPGMGGGMMPGMMPGFPDPFMPPGGNPFGAPKGNQPPKPQRP